MIWKKQLYAGTGGLEEHDPRRGTCMIVNLICLIIFLISLSLGSTFFFITGKFAILIGASCEEALMIGVIKLNNGRRYSSANTLICAGLTVATCYFSAVFGRMFQAQLMLVALIGLAMFIFNEVQVRTFFVAAIIPLIVLVEANWQWQWIHPVRTGPAIEESIRWLSYAVVISLVILSLYMFDRNKKLLFLKVQEYAKAVEFNLVNEVKEGHAKTIFIRNASHEIRSALFSINGISKLIKDNLQTRDEWRDLEILAEHLVAACHNLKSVTNNLLTQSKLEAGMLGDIHNEPVNIRQLLRNLILISQYSANERQVKISFYASDAIPQILLCDGAKITSIVTNLLNNAIKFTRDNSNILVRVDRHEDNWQLLVEDEGEGMSTEMMETIFEPFVTRASVTRNTEGIGLGLHITRQLVEAMHGEIAVKSKLNVGTFFSVSFPIHALGANEPAVSAPSLH
jgi:signal transduction histidine kinase